MGMFDDVAVSDPLPTNPEMDELGLNKRDWSLQTKDFDRALDLYVVQEGKLFVRKYAIEEWIEGKKDSRDPMERMGRMHRDAPFLELVKFTGQFQAYDFRMDIPPHWDAWVKWLFTVVDGKVTHVELLEFEKTDNTERKARQKELLERLEREAKLWRNRFFFHTRPVVWVSLKWFYFRCWLRAKLSY